MADRKQERRGLGRGLSALMADVQPEPSQDSARRLTHVVPVEKLEPNPDQPRRSFPPEELESLANSIREKGIIQPLIVRKNRSKTDSYEIVAGERRWRAAQMAKLHEIPVLVRELDDREVLEIAIIENIQREDLNPVDEAKGFRLLMDRFGHTQDEMSKALSKSRSHIANMLRLLQLPDEVQTLLQDGKLSTGHARALITSPEASKLAKEVLARGLSVRETERLVKAGVKKSDKKTKKSGNSKDADTVNLEQELSATIGMKVSIDHKNGTETGAVTIRYGSMLDLDALCSALSIMPPAGSR